MTTESSPFELDDTILAAHEALRSAAQDIAHAADVLMRRLTELTRELEELHTRYGDDVGEARRRLDTELARAREENQRSIQKLEVEGARREAEARSEIEALRHRVSELEATLKRVHDTLI